MCSVTVLSPRSDYSTVKLQVNVAAPDSLLISHPFMHKQKHLWGALMPPSHFTT